MVNIFQALTVIGYWLIGFDELQRTLYQQAKNKPKWKAWSLYADLCRKDFIDEAMSRVLENKGASGVDGYTVDAMKAEWDSFRDELQSELT